MKVYKTEPNQYGWYMAIHINKDGTLKVFKKCIYRERRKNETDIWLSEKDADFLRKRLNKNFKDKELK